MGVDPSQTQLNLAEVREEIDAVDAGLLQLLIRRFRLVEEVRLAKAGVSDAPVRPLRPAREAEVLRRLMEAAGDGLPRSLVFRLWRMLMCQASRNQADVRLHVQNRLLSDADLRRIIEDHFNGFPLVVHRTAGALFAALAEAPADAGVVEPDRLDTVQMFKHDAPDLSVVTSLPFLTSESRPKLLVLAHGPAERTGDDETLVMTAGQLPRDFAPTPLWMAQTRDGHHLSSLPGFLSDAEGPLIGLKRNAGLELKVLGRFPSPQFIRE